MAIRLTASFLIVILMVGFANIEWFLWQKQSVDLISLVTEYLYHAFCRFLLVFITIEDTTAVLRTDIRSYPIRLRRVVNLEEKFAERLV